MGQIVAFWTHLNVHVFSRAANRLTFQSIPHKIFEPRRNKLYGQFRILYDKERRDFCNPPSIDRVLVMGWIYRWDGGDKKCVKNFVAETSLTLGIPTRIWKDTVKVYLTKLGSEVEACSEWLRITTRGRLWYTVSILQILLPQNKYVN
jgi:hypothetical protein